MSVHGKRKKNAAMSENEERKRSVKGGREVGRGNGLVVSRVKGASPRSGERE